MDNPTTLIVAIMYVTIVVTGLVNVLMTLSDIVVGKRSADPLYTSWAVLLVLAYLSFFWETRAVLDVEGWDFPGFVSFIVGPIIMLFATNLFVSPNEDGEPAMLDKQWLEQSARFFLLLCLVQAWVVGLDLVFESVGIATYMTIGTGILLIGLAVSKDRKAHLAGNALIWLAFVSRVILQAL